MSAADQIVEDQMDTRLGPLHVRHVGSGPVAVLWHSLFVDSTTWRHTLDALAEHRRLVMIDGPGHGHSPGPRHRYTLEDCAAAAGDILDKMDVNGPVDWIGNAWGGHVGIFFASASPGRCRSLVAVATPVHALSAPERRQIAAGRLAYRLLGPIGPLTQMITDALLGPDAEPKSAQLLAAAFRHADRRGMTEAIRSISIERPDLHHVLRHVEVPTLFIAAQDDPLWSPSQARAAVAHAPRGSAVALPGRGHLAPLLDSPDRLAATIAAFWADHTRADDPARHESQHGH